MQRASKGIGTNSPTRIADLRASLRSSLQLKPKLADLQASQSLARRSSAKARKIAR